MDPHLVTTPKEQPEPRIAQVLFMDIVKYSALNLRQMHGAYYQLQDLVKNTEEYQQKKSDLVLRSSGDAMAIAFFDDPLAPIRCAIEVNRNLRRQTRIRLRTGIHSGVISRATDVTQQPDVIGDAINIAQRVASGGDPDHILLSQEMGNILISLGDWTDCISEIIQIQTKDRRLFVHNFFSDEFGNPNPPESQIAKVKTKPPESPGGSAGASHRDTGTTHQGREPEIFGSREVPPTQVNKPPLNRARYCGGCGLSLFPDSEWCPTCGTLNK